MTDDVWLIILFDKIITSQFLRTQRSPPQSCHTVDSDAAAGLLPELQLQQVQPIIHNLVGGRSTIVEGPILQKKRGKREITSPGQKEKQRAEPAAGKEKCYCRGRDGWRVFFPLLQCFTPPLFFFKLAFLNMLIRFILNAFRTSLLSLFYINRWIWIDNAAVLLNFFQGQKELADSLINAETMSQLIH